MSAVCGLRFTDFRQVAFSCKQRSQFILIAPDKAAKQSLDLSVCVYVLFTVIFTILRSLEQDVNTPWVINKIPNSLHKIH